MNLQTLKYCDRCIQMTNHNPDCLKCVSLQTLQQELVLLIGTRIVDTNAFMPEFTKLYSQDVDAALLKAYTLGLRKGVEMVEEKVPANKDFLWENGECSVCGYDSYHNEGTEHYCDICNTYRTEILTNIKNLKEELK